MYDSYDEMMNSSFSKEGVPSMFYPITTSRQSLVAPSIQERAKAFQHEDLQERWVTSAPKSPKTTLATTKLTNAKKRIQPTRKEEEEEEETKSVQVTKKAEEESTAAVEEPTKQPEPQQKKSQEEIQKEKYEQWVEQQHKADAAEQKEIVLSEAYKAEREAKKQQRREKKNAERQAKKEMREKQLEEALASNPAIAAGQALLNQHNFISPTEQRRLRASEMRFQEQKILKQEQEQRIRTRFSILNERMEQKNAEALQLAQEYEAQAAKIEEEKAKQKAEKQAKKLELQRKKEEYQKRRDARRRASQAQAVRNPALHCTSSLAN